MEAFILGLSNGGICLAYCAPVLVPCVMAGGGGAAASAGVLLRFLCGRLAGYLIFGVAAWAVSASLLKDAYRAPVIGFAYMAIAVALVLYGFFDIGRCSGASCRWASRLAAAAGRLHLPSPRALRRRAGYGLEPVSPVFTGRGRVGGEGQPPLQPLLFPDVLCRYVSCSDPCASAGPASSLSGRKNGRTARGGAHGRLLFFLGANNICRRY